jgi:hypothetical protein
VYTLADSTGDPALSYCVENKIKRWIFPVEVSGEALWPFVFQQRRL